jgi:hypothetical protein
MKMRCHGKESFLGVAGQVEVPGLTARRHPSRHPRLRATTALGDEQIVELFSPVLDDGARPSRDGSHLQKRDTYA